MQHINLPLSQPEDHLALDEALLLAADAGEIGESLRLWELESPTVVVGRGSPVAVEVDVDFCRGQGIPILRRCSGGAAIVAGPGCLMYSVVISLQQQPQLRKIDAAHHYVLQRVSRAVQTSVTNVAYQGTSDLTWNDRKFSGNSLRITRQHLLYHGTILYRADLDLISQCLLVAPRQPEYRAGRDHRAFITNLPIQPERFGADLIAQFDINEKPLEASRVVQLENAIRSLRQDRYDSPDWHFRH